MNNDQLEAKILELGLTAPRVTRKDIEDEIVSEHTFVGGDGVYGAARKRGDESIQAFPEQLDRLTFHVITLRNGYVVVGNSACVSKENFNADLGKSIARENAIQQCWGLMGFNLMQHIYTLNERAKHENAS